MIAWQDGDRYDDLLMQDDREKDGCETIARGERQVDGDRYGNSLGGYRLGGDRLGEGQMVGLRERQASG